ncbi:MAG: transposase [Psychromonas sp.]|nr:transposase [Psychromonas sp.]
MNEIITILACFHPRLYSKTYKQLLIVSQAMLAMTGRITLLSINRWTEKAGSYRALQRFFESHINWVEHN